jgi:hypothetical protein
MNADKAADAVTDTPGEEIDNPKSTQELMGISSDLSEVVKRRGTAVMKPTKTPPLNGFIRDLENGQMGFYGSELYPVITGQVSYGSFVADCVVLGYKWREQTGGDKGPYGRWNAEQCGQTIKRWVDKTFDRNKRSLTVRGYLTHQ